MHPTKPPLPAVLVLARASRSADDGWMFCMPQDAEADRRISGHVLKMHSSRHLAAPAPLVGASEHSGGTTAQQVHVT